MDYGFAGDVEQVNPILFQQLLDSRLTPIIAPITHNGQGQLLNTNADTIAQEPAKGLSTNFAVQLIYLFEKSGVLLDADDDKSVIREITPDSYHELKEKKLVFAGMIPKLDNAFSALDHGVKKVVIGKAEELHQIVDGEKGTSIIHG